MTTDIAQGPVDVNVSQLTAERGTQQYCYKDNACKANTANDADCICWYDEGIGPFPDERSDDPCPIKEWRFKPANAKVSGARRASEPTPSCAASPYDLTLCQRCGHEAPHHYAGCAEAK